MWTQLIDMHHEKFRRRHLAGLPPDMRLAMATPASAAASTAAMAGRHFVHVADLPEPPLGAAHPANALTATPCAAAIGGQLYGVSDWNAPTDLHEAGLIGGMAFLFLKDTLD